MIVTAFVATLLTLGVSGYKIDPCGGCTGSLLKQSTHPDAQVDVADIGRLVVYEINQDALLKILKETVSEASDINDLWGMPKLKAKMVSEKLRPSIAKVIEDLVTEESQTHETTTSGVAESVLQTLKKNIDEANKVLDERREAALNQLTHSIINDMWAITSSKIRNSSVDTYNVSKSEYQLLVKELLPELAQATNLTEFKKVLSYPVIVDELNLIIRKTNVTGSVQELTDKMFTKLDPFIREALLVNVKKIENPGAAEDALRQIKENFGSQLEMATHNGLVRAGKFQNVLTKEMEDHAIVTNFVEMAKPDITAAVESIMNWLKSRGISAKGVVKEDILLSYIMARARVPGKNIHITVHAIGELTKKFQALVKSEKSWPHLFVIDRFTSGVVYPMIQEVVIESIEKFRQNNPQLSECGSTVFAATIVGSIKAEVKSLTQQYLTTMTGSVSTDVTDGDQSALNYVLEAIKESLQKAIEEEAMDQENFESDMFMKSKAFEDINLQVESSIHSIVMKELQKSDE